jgi:hypothetical protein
MEAVKWVTPGAAAMHYVGAPPQSSRKLRTEGSVMRKVGKEQHKTAAAYRFVAARGFFGRKGLRPPALGRAGLQSVLSSEPPSAVPRGVAAGSGARDPPKTLFHACSSRRMLTDERFKLLGARPRQLDQDRRQTHSISKILAPPGYARTRLPISSLVRNQSRTCPW